MARRTAQRRAPRRRAPRRRRRPSLKVLVISLLLAGAFAAAAITGLVSVSRSRDEGPFRFPTPGGVAADARPAG